MSKSLGKSYGHQAGTGKTTLFAMAHRTHEFSHDLTKVSHYLTCKNILKMLATTKNTCRSRKPTKVPSLHLPNCDYVFAGPCAHLHKDEYTRSVTEWLWRHGIRIALICKHVMSCLQIEVYSCLEGSGGDAKALGHAQGYAQACKYTDIH